MQQWHNCPKCDRLIQYGQSNCFNCGSPLNWETQPHQTQQELEKSKSNTWKNTKYQNFWDKTLSEDEKVEFEFSISRRYINFSLIVWAIISLLFLFVYGFGILIFLIALFYFGFYLERANAYGLTNKGVIINRGWLSTHTTSLDYSKIKDVAVLEPFFDRTITQTGSIAVSTSGLRYEVVLKHIDSPYEVKKKLDSLRVVYRSPIKTELQTTE